MCSFTKYRKVEFPGSVVMRSHGVFFLIIFILMLCKLFYYLPLNCFSIKTFTFNAVLVQQRELILHKTKKILCVYDKKRQTIVLMEAQVIPSVQIDGLQSPPIITLQSCDKAHAMSFFLVLIVCLCVHIHVRQCVCMCGEQW